MSELANCGKNDTYHRNACRNLHKFIHVKNKTMPVPITSVKIPLRARTFALRKKTVVEPWPCVLPTDWAKLCLGDPVYQGFFLLGGHTLKSLSKAESMLATFWSRYRFVDSEVVPKDVRRTIPIYLHGDEGRGLVKRPLLVISFQPAIGCEGDSKTNAHGNLVQLG